MFNIEQIYETGEKQEEGRYIDEKFVGWDQIAVMLHMPLPSLRLREFGNIHIEEMIICLNIGRSRPRILCLSHNSYILDLLKGEDLGWFH